MRYLTGNPSFDHHGLLPTQEEMAQNINAAYKKHVDSAREKGMEETSTALPGGDRAKSWLTGEGRERREYRGPPKGGCEPAGRHYRVDDDDRGRKRDKEDQKKPQRTHEFQAEPQVRETSSRPSRSWNEQERDELRRARRNSNAGENNGGYPTIIHQDHPARRPGSRSRPPLSKGARPQYAFVPENPPHPHPSRRNSYSSSTGHRDDPRDAYNPRNSSPPFIHPQSNSYPNLHKPHQQRFESTRAPDGASFGNQPPYRDGRPDSVHDDPYPHRKNSASAPNLKAEHQDSSYGYEKRKKPPRRASDAGFHTPNWYEAPTDYQSRSPPSPTIPYERGHTFVRPEDVSDPYKSQKWGRDTRGPSGGHGRRGSTTYHRAPVDEWGDPILAPEPPRRRNSQATYMRYNTLPPDTPLYPPRKGDVRDTPPPKTRRRDSTITVEVHETTRRGSTSQRRPSISKDKGHREKTYFVHDDGYFVHDDGRARRRR
ncbi:hypothetical protein T439DRAFT_359683 [Meredithblackwellia eburnea MCA 4105]